MLTDANGKPRARLEVGKEGPALSFLDASGSTTASTGMKNDNLELRLYGSQGATLSKK